MTSTPAKYRRARAAFLLRVGQTKRWTERRCEHTLPLFPLCLILAADGTLTSEARRLAQRVQA